MQAASEAFSANNPKKAIEVYTSIIQSNQKQLYEQALLNRSSAYYSLAMYDKSLEDIEIYLESKNEEKPKVQGFVLWLNCLIKQRTILDEKSKKIMERGKLIYPYHQKYAELIKKIEQIQIVEDDDEFMDRMFQKLIAYPQIRNHMQEQSFLTKVQKMIRNPSLASALIKIDARLADVQEILLMSEM